MFELIQFPCDYFSTGLCNDFHQTVLFPHLYKASDIDLAEIVNEKNSIVKEKGQT